MKRDEFDKAFYKLSVELEDREAAEVITEAVIGGRLSIYVLAEQAIGAKLTLPQFTAALKIIVDKELKTGRVDKDSFDLMKDYKHPDQKLLEGDPE